MPTERNPARGTIHFGSAHLIRNSILAPEVEESLNTPIDTSEPASLEPSDDPASESGAPSVDEEAGSNQKLLVYMTANISPEGLMAVYGALGREAAGDNVAVKIHTGVPGGNHFLFPDLTGSFVRTIDGTIVACNTAVSGRRASTALHYQVAEDHGFTAIAKKRAEKMYDNYAQDIDSMTFDIHNTQEQAETVQQTLAELETKKTAV